MSSAINLARSSAAPDSFDAPSVNGRTLKLLLSRHRSQARTRGAVLLMHGASASSDTFLLPHGHSLVEYLTAKGFDVWLLDWRGGLKVSDQYLDVADRDAFTMDMVVDHDIPLAIDRVRKSMASEQKAGLPLHLVAHCFGAGCLAMSIAAGKLQDRGVTNVVLLTLGLFYVAPWDGFIKADDFVLERVLGTAEQVTAIHPGGGWPRTRPDKGWPQERERARLQRASIIPRPSTTSQTPRIWPAEMEEAFECWPRQLLPTCNIPLCHRVSFMFGQPYLEENLADGIHTIGMLDKLFGSMPIQMYVHAGQNVRRGYAAPFDARGASNPDLHRYVQREPFEAHHVTLITGTENTIWHCDSIHRMYDWLMSGRLRRVSKRVIGGYAHQDLLWGKTSDNDVYPHILAGLDARS